VLISGEALERAERKKYRYVSGYIRREKLALFYGKYMGIYCMYVILFERNCIL
jgi:hypothetical protein